MKKLMIAAAIVCAAAFAQAATYSWNATGMAAYSASTTGYQDFNGYTVYAFDANTIAMATLAENLSTKGADDLSKALNSGAVSGFQYAFGGTGITDDGASPMKHINGYLVLVSDAIDGKQYFATAAVAPIDVTETVIGSGAPLAANFMMTALPGAGATGWTQIAAVPEPTSGLLLLLGVAGLALKRRRA